jgi:hypothetical protein
LYSGVHHYETEEIRNSLGITVLKSGLRISQNWKTNGNFLEMINSKIDTIEYDENEQIVKVYILTGFIPSLSVGDQVQISNVSEVQYNGKQVVTQILSGIGENANGFAFELPFVPNVKEPKLSDPRKEEVLFTVPETSQITANSYYYEFWDDGLGYSVQIPSTSFVRTVTNYEYENQLQEDKRNIFILKPRYLNVVFNDMEDNMLYKKGSTQYVSETLKRGDNIRLYT